jgi:hypothetical protein
MDSENQKSTSFRYSNRIAMSIVISVLDTISIRYRNKIVPLIGDCGMRERRKPDDLGDRQLADEVRIVDDSWTFECAAVTYVG